MAVVMRLSCATDRAESVSKMSKTIKAKSGCARQAQTLLLLLVPLHLPSLQSTRAAGLVTARFSTDTTALTTETGWTHLFRT
ncbi:unnamed protein product [Protopolystoma xenopodis]|uniref:Uncharacterized protein n=1 Tax=Protopolystoma xenopodis TaxID=117903 RepID=A0A448X535_9PLAT|nr:unnamed protein product [Protopolystoma xenopodis]